MTSGIPHNSLSPGHDSDKVVEQVVLRMFTVDTNESSNYYSVEWCRELQHDLEKMSWLGFCTGPCSSCYHELHYTLS